MSVSDDHSEDDLLATVVPSVDTCSHIFSAADEQKNGSKTACCTSSR